MAKKIIATVKLQIPEGQATPTPPVGPALGVHGVNIMEFCKAFNAKTGGGEGLVVPAVVTIYADRSFTFILKSPPASVLLKRAAGIAKASGTPNRETIGTVTHEQVQAIAERKKVDLNAGSLEAAIRIIEGTAKTMGIQIADAAPPPAEEGS